MTDTYPPNSQLLKGHHSLSLRLAFFLITAFQVTFNIYFNEVAGSVWSIVYCYCSSFYLSLSIGRNTL